MRIIGGRYKGKKLLSPKNDKTRPTSDRVKEAIFNIIFDKVEDAVVIDAFSGSGALGIEALSRGAKKVYFIDKDYLAAELIKRNLEDLEGDRKIIRAEAKTAFRSLAGEGVKADLIFLDPPYSAGLYEGAVKDIADNNLLDTDGLVILEKASTDEKDYSYKNLRQYRQKKYGNTLICLLSYVKRAAVTGTFDPITLGHIRLIEQALLISPNVNVALLKNENKKEFFDSEFRLELIKKAIAPYGERVKADKYDGLAIDYCKQNNVQLLIRGIRNEADAQYEQAMADWNKAHGGIDTLFVQAEDKQLSSSEVRKRLTEGLSVKGMVPDLIIDMLEDKIKTIKEAEEKDDVKD